MNSEITSLKDLYKLLLPALESKKREMHDLKYLYVTEEDIWNYIKETVWSKTTDLTLADMVSDILHTENEKIAKYIASGIALERNETEDN